jgi:flagellar hook protein FlgE
MSFYTALTGLNGAQSDIAASSNNIANVGTTGFKLSRAEFGDIFATSPLQNSTSSIGSGAILKGVKQQFTQGNIAASLNALDMAISGQGFFALKPSLTSTQVVYTRNGSFNVDNNRNVVDSSGQFLLTYPVNEDGSVTAKDIDSAVPLRLPVTSGDPQATTNVDLSVNVPSSADVVTDNDKFVDGYIFDPDDAESFTNSTSFTIFDDLGNPTIATVYFIKTQRATAEDPTNKFETRLVINDEIVPPNLVPAVIDDGSQIYIDQFGNQTTDVPDPSYFNTGRSSPLYKLDNLRSQVPSKPAALTGEESGFDFGDEGTREIEIVNDPMLFGATYEADPGNQGVYWGNDFLLVNIDDGTRPVSIDIRAGKYNAEDLAVEVQRAINESYDDEKKIEIRKGAEDQFEFQMFSSGADGSDTGLTETVKVDLLEASFVSAQAGIDVANLTAPSFDINTFLAHAQVRINDAMNAQLNEATPAVPGIAANKFAKITSTAKLTSPPDMPQSFEFDYTSRDLNVTNVSTTSAAYEISYDEGEFTVTAVSGKVPLAGKTIDFSINGTVIPVAIDAGDTTVAAVLAKIDTAVKAHFTSVGGDEVLASATDAGTLSFTISEKRYLGYTNFGNRPKVEVFEKQSAVASSSTAIEYDAEADNLTITLAANHGLAKDDTIVLMGAGNSTSFLNGRTFNIREVDGDVVQISTGDLGLQDTNLTVEIKAANNVFVLSEKATDVEAFFEGADLQIPGAASNFNNQRIVMRETDSVRHAYSSVDLDTTDATDVDIFGAFAGQLSFTDNDNPENENPDGDVLGFSSNTTELEWVDERNPPVQIQYDAGTQSFVFKVDHTALGPGGTISDISGIQISSGYPDSINAIGLSGVTNASKVAISAATNVSGKPFIQDGGTAGRSPDRFGAQVKYDRDAGGFTFESGTTGKSVRANKALGVEVEQPASNIQVGRYEINSTTGVAETGDGTIDLASRVLAKGGSHVMGVGADSNIGFLEGTGLKSQPALAIGNPAKDPLNSQPIFLNPSNAETTFNVSVNGVTAIIEVPGGNYIGTTLAEVLEQRINQMRDPESGQTIGGVTVKYQPTENNFVFTTGTTGDTSTIRVQGPAKLGLDDVPLGVGSVPTIANLVQATNQIGTPLFVNEDGEIVESEPDNLVTDYFPLYLDEGELTFDKTGRLISPQGLTRYESQSETFSISLDIDYSGSSQLATPFSVNNLDQNGFTSGRLDGLDIDANGLLRANYTNGQNKPLGKIVLANFNNQNGLKQVGNATFVETASSGEAIVGEAGTEGFGSIQSGALERSNVDITEELVNLITAQRNFQASSKAIETSTQLTQTIINIRT